MQKNWDVEFSVNITIRNMEDSILQTCFAGKLILDNPTKPFIFILVVKHITCNTKIGEIISICVFFLKRTMQAAVVSKKKTAKGNFRNK